MKTGRSQLFSALLACAGLGAPLALARPAVTDPKLVVEQVADGLGGGIGQIATGFVFVSPTTVLAVKRGDGSVVRLDLGITPDAPPAFVATPGPTVANLDIVSPTASDSQTEYGVQGMCLHPDFANNRYVYIRYDLSPTPGIDTAQSLVATLPNFSASVPTQNVTDRFVWDPSANAGAGALVFDQRVISTTFDTRYHHGGSPVFGPDGKIYIPVGDLRHATWISGHSGLLISSNYAGTTTQDMGVILRLNDDGTTPSDNPFVSVPGSQRWFAYGVRNTFGAAFDPVTGALWTTDNGENTFDEVNLVFSGFNSGHADIMGPVNHPQQSGSIAGLVNLPGGVYADPRFSWLGTIGVTGIAHLYASALGVNYNNAVLVGGVNQGFLWAFRLNAARDGFAFSNAGLQDLVHDVADGYATPIGTEGEELLFGTGFGVVRAATISMSMGPDRLPYVLAGTGKIYRVRRAVPCPADLTGDDLVNTADLLVLLPRFGENVVPFSPADLNGDGVVNTLDLIAFISAFGEDCN